MATNTWRVRSLKAVLRDALKRSDMSAREVARRLDVSHTKVNRWLDDDTGAPTAEDVSAVLAVIGLTGDERDRILSMARATASDWLVSGPPGINPQLASVMECERDALRITEWAPLVIPGLLQTGEYAQHIISRGSAALSDQEIETRVMMRIARRDALTRRRPVELCALIGIPAIRGGIGGGDVMADQMAHLAAFAKRDNVVIQVCDLAGEWHAGFAGAFILYEFDDMPATVYLEHHRSGAFLVDEADVADYKTAAAEIRRVAMSPDETAGLIASVIPSSSMETTI